MESIIRREFNCVNFASSFDDNELPVVERCLAKYARENVARTRETRAIVDDRSMASFDRVNVCRQRQCRRILLQKAQADFESGLAWR